MEPSGVRKSFLPCDLGPFNVRNKHFPALAIPSMFQIKKSTYNSLKIYVLDGIVHPRKV